MTFLDSFYLSTYLLAYVGILSLVVTRYLPYTWLFIPLLVIALVRSRFWHENREKIPSYVWNSISILFAIFLFLTQIVPEREFVTALLDFTIYLQLLRIFTAKTNREYFQVYLLSFTHLTAATILSSEMVFAIPFTLYIFLAPWTFILYNLKTQIEQPVHESELDRKRVDILLRSRQLVSSRLFVTTSLLSLIILSSTMVIFFLFPRVSFGYLFKKARSHQNVSGFTEQINLSNLGTIKESNTVVMRVEIDPKYKNLTEHFYWRGLAYDRYDGQEWHRSLRGKQYRQRFWMKYKNSEIAFRDYTPPSNRELVKQTIFLEPLDTTVLFAADRLIRIQWQKIFLEKLLRANLGIDRDAYRAFHFISSLTNDRHYIAYSDIYDNSEQVLRSASGPIQGPFMSLYNQLPPLSKEFYEFAQRITENQTNLFDKASKIEQYLTNNYGYTLNLVDHSEEAPIEDFLFRTKKAHCEYFATAMVLLSRSVGLHARLVSGFRGGEWNDYGQYIAVRQKDAHTWVEVFFPQFGWQRFDPTPPDHTATDYNEARFAAFNNFIDYLELRWYKYIINYDLKSQFTYAKDFYMKSIAGFSSIRTTTTFKLPDFLKRLKLLPGGSSRGTGLSILLGLILFITFGLLLIFVLRKFARGNFKLTRTGKRPEVVVLQKMEKLLAKRGHVREPHQTPLEFAEGVEKEAGAPYQDLPPFASIYYQLRFGKKIKKGSGLSRLEAIFNKITRM